MKTTTGQKEMAIQVTIHQFFQKKSVLLNTIRFPRGKMELIKEVDLELYTEHIDYTLQSLFIQLSSFGL